MAGLIRRRQVVVMIVDDDVAGAEQLADELRQKGRHHVIVCNALDREKMLATLEHERPDVLLLDRWIAEDRRGGDKLAMAIKDRVEGIQTGASRPAGPDTSYAP